MSIREGPKILTLFTMGSTRTYSPWGGAIWPPSQKMAGNALFEIKLGRITKSDVKIKKNPNMFNMTSL